jgi:hypothetical protein
MPQPLVSTQADKDVWGISLPGIPEIIVSCPYRENPCDSSSFAKLLDRFFDLRVSRVVTLLKG